MTGMTPERLAEIRARVTTPHWNGWITPNEVRDLVAEIQRLTNDLAVTEAQAIDRDEAATILAQQVEKVRALHFTVVPADWLGGPTRCRGCGDTYPCPTIQALDA